MQQGLSAGTLPYLSDAKKTLSLYFPWKPKMLEMLKRIHAWTAIPLFSKTGIAHRGFDILTYEAKGNKFRRQAVE